MMAAHSVSHIELMAGGTGWLLLLGGRSQAAGTGCAVGALGMGKAFLIGMEKRCRAGLPSCSTSWGRLHPVTGEADVCVPFPCTQQLHPSQLRDGNSFSPGSLAWLLWVSSPLVLCSAGGWGLGGWVQTFPFLWCCSGCPGTSAKGLYRTE